MWPLFTRRSGIKCHILTTEAALVKRFFGGLPILKRVPKCQEWLKAQTGIKLRGQAVKTTSAR
jgi:hypothetical protein